MYVSNLSYAFQICLLIRIAHFYNCIQIFEKLTTIIGILTEKHRNRDIKSSALRRFLHVDMHSNKASEIVNNQMAEHYLKVVPNLIFMNQFC